MKSIARTMKAVVWLLPFLSGFVYAENNSNLIFNATTTNFGVGLIIGNTGTNNSLQIYNAGAVTNTTATVGSGAGASNNFVIVSDLGSIWNSSGGLTFGSGGGNNQMTITNGGRVNALNLSMGVSDNNTLTVTGTNSLLSTPGSSVVVGGGGKNNIMTIADGGQVANADGYIGFSSVAASNNTVVVNGGVWTNTSIFNIGYASPNNRLIVTNGGKVYNISTSFLGGNAAANSNAGNNSVLVSDSNSLWKSGLGLNIGQFAGGNSLTVSNGGQVVVGGATKLGANAGSGTNTVLVTGAGSLWTNNGAVTFGTGSGAGANSLSVSSTGQVVMVGAFTLGNSSVGNSLTISSGGQVVVVGTTVVGSLAGSDSNTVLVTGAGSVWSNTSSITFGNSGGGGNNQMTISNGGRVNASFFQLGFTDNNTLTVTGTNSLFSTPGSFVVGEGAKNNTMTIADGGQVANADGYIGFTSVAGSNSTVVVSGGVWTNTTTLNIGYAAPNSQLIVTNGGKVYDLSGSFMGGNAAANANAGNNSVLVSDSNSLWKSSSGLSIGKFAGGNSLTVSNGGQAVFAGTTLVGANAGSGTNTMLVTGAGSLWTNNGAFTIGSASGGNSLSVNSTGKVVVVGNTVLGNSSGGNSLSISSGGQFVEVGTSLVGSLAGSDGNTVLVTGAGSVWSNTSSITVGNSGGGRSNQITISNGGRVDGSFFQLGFSDNNTLTVTGTNSLLSTPGPFVVGEGGHNNSMTISGGGRVVNNDGYVGFVGGGSNSQVLITGAGSIWQNGAGLNVGSNATSKGVNSRLLVSDGGTLEATSFASGFNGTGSISNNAGIYQFALASPTITPNTAGSIMITNGTISFRGIADANVFSDTGAGALALIAFQGNNTFRLNSSSNTTAVAQNYTFDTGRGATNYVGLELVNGNSLWRSANLTIGSGGTFLASNTVGTVAALVTNIGSIEVNNSKMTWSSNVVISGRYKSDPSTNTFLAEVTIAESGSLAGGAGDLFDFKKNLLIHSTNRFAFDLDSSGVQFSGGGMHTNAITGQDFGTNDLGYAVNFAYGELHLGSSSDQICFTCGNIPTVASNGLYIGWLDLLGNANLVTNLHAASGINLYYDKTDSRNAYLGAASYQLTDCAFANGGGFLMPVIPEPSLLLLSATAIGLVFLRKARCA